MRRQRQCVLSKKYQCQNFCLVSLQYCPTSYMRYIPLERTVNFFPEDSLTIMEGSLALSFTLDAKPASFFALWIEEFCTFMPFERFTKSCQYQTFSMIQLILSHVLLSSGPFSI